MIRVTIEIVPHGREESKRNISVIEIANVGGDVDWGRYDYRIFSKQGQHDASDLREWTTGERPKGNLKARGSGVHHDRNKDVEVLLYRILDHHVNSGL